MTGWRGAALLGLAFSLAGCIRLGSPSMPVHEYTLGYEPPVLEGAALPVVLRLSPLRMASAYAGGAIVYRDSEHEISSYHYQRWFTDPASMVTDLLGRDLVASGLYKAVQQGPSALRSDYELSGEIEEIEERTSGGCSAHLRATLLLLHVPPAEDNRVVFQRTYTADERCDRNDTSGFVEAMSRALYQISMRVQNDVFEAITTEQKQN